MRMRYGVLAAAAMTLLSTTAGALDFTGYTRVGPGQKQNSGDGQRCFDGGAGGAALGSQAPGHGGVGRLGNECNTYGEFGLIQSADVNGVNYKAQLMTNFFSQGSVPVNGTDVNEDSMSTRIMVVGAALIVPALAYVRAEPRGEANKTERNNVLPNAAPLRPS